MSRTNAQIAQSMTVPPVRASQVSQLLWLLRTSRRRSWHDARIHWSTGSGRHLPASARFAAAMGSADGSSEILMAQQRSSPQFAALVNVAASHVAEQDDFHNGSVFHPGAVVFPPALGVAQAIGASKREFLTAVVAGYEVGIRIGEFLGHSHYRIFRTTGTVGIFAAAAAVDRLLKLSPAQMGHAFGSAGTQTAGLLQCLRDAAGSKQLHAAHAGRGRAQSAYLRPAGLPVQSISLRASKAWRRECGRMPIRPASMIGWAHGGRLPKPCSNITHRTDTLIRRPMRCLRACATTSSLQEMS